MNDNDGSLARAVGLSGWLMRTHHFMGDETGFIISILFSQQSTGSSLFVVHIYFFSSFPFCSVNKRWIFFYIHIYMRELNGCIEQNALLPPAVEFETKNWINIGKRCVRARMHLGSSFEVHAPAVFAGHKIRPKNRSRDEKCIPCERPSPRRVYLL